MKILHSYCLNYNIGDYALGIGVKNVLREYLPVDLIGETNLQGRTFDEYYINEVVNKRYDLLVIGGGGIIHGSHWPNGWFWLIDKDLIKTIKIPFIIYGAGNNYFDNESMPQKAIDHLKETAKYASFFSVRNDGSHERILAQTGIDAVEIPDPGFHVDLNTEYKRPMTEKYVIVQLANDKPEFRYENESAKNQFVTSLRNVVKEIAKNYKVVLAPHVFDDVALSNEVIDGIDNCEVWDFSYYAFDHSDKALAYYKYAEFVLAMRGHGQIVPICFNVPVVSLQNHPKHGGLMKKLGLSDYNIEVKDPDFEQKLQEIVSQIDSQKDTLRAEYQKINMQLSSDTEHALTQIKSKLGM